MATTISSETESSQLPSPQALRTQLDRDGFVLIRGAFKQEQLESLRAAAEHITALARARTDAERGADPFAARLPAMRVVDLAPGDLVFYDNNILHRGVYGAGTERLTLHGSVGHVKGGTARARNVLQHGVGEWVGECDFSGLPGGIGARAEGMRQRLCEMGRASGDVGFSHTD